MTRWKLLDRTSPSGKLLYECQECGRVSPAPDKTCAAGCGGGKKEEAFDQLQSLIDRFADLTGKPAPKVRDAYRDFKDEA